MTGLIQKSDTMMSKEDMKAFIKGTVEEIMIEIYKTIEMTLESKVKEKTKTLKKDIDQLTKDIESLRKENDKLKKDLTEAQKKNCETERLQCRGCKQPTKMSSTPEKNNVKILNIEEETTEDEGSDPSSSVVSSSMSSLIDTVSDLLQKQGVTITAESIIAIHRIPSKPGTIKPVQFQCKFINYFNSIYFSHYI